MENFQSLREIFSLIRESLQEGSLIHESAILIGAMMCLVAIVEEVTKAIFPSFRQPPSHSR